MTRAHDAAAAREPGAHRLLSPTAHPADASKSAPAGSSRVNAEMGTSGQSIARLARLDRRVIAVAAVVVALQIAVAGRYGWHRDELYFLACSRHLAWGYVDQPPFTPLVARAATAMFGPSLYGLRLFPALTRAMVVLAGVLAGNSVDDDALRSSPQSRSGAPPSSSRLATCSPPRCSTSWHGPPSPRSSSTSFARRIRDGGRSSESSPASGWRTSTALRSSSPGSRSACS